MNIPIIAVTDQIFDAALERFAFIDESLVEKNTLAGRKLDRDEILDRYQFTSLVEALRSEEFGEDALETVQDLELPDVFESEDAAWEAVKDFYAERDCVLLHVGDAEQFIVGREIAVRLGLL
jgi:hypothetical protein